MANHLVYKPLLNKCHLIHLNDNKYRFQLIRAHGKKKKAHGNQQHQHVVFDNDNGDITLPNPISVLFGSGIDGFGTEEFRNYNRTVADDLDIGHFIPN
jgi:hypothetical protein